MKAVLNTENYKVMKNYMKYICAILMLLGSSAHAWGAIVSIKGTSNDTWTYTSSQIAITKSGVTLAAKGYGTGTALASEVRVNNGTTITISASQAITKVEFTITSTAGFNQVDWDGVWTGSSTSVDFTAGGGQVVFTECKVTIGGYVILHDFAGDRMVAEEGTLPAVRLGTLKGWASAQYWTHVEVDDGNWPAYGTYYYEGTSAPSKDELWALYQNSCDNSYSTEPTSVYHISETNPASTSGGGAGYVKAYVSSVETYCNIPAGTSVEIRATAEGTPFASWTVTKYGDASTVVTVASSTSATTTFTMPAYDISLTGVFNGCTSREVTVFDEGSNESKTCNYGAVTSFDVEYVTDGSGAVTWTSTNTDVATVAGKGGDAATVTIVGAGTANIKATIAEDATYCVGEDVYPLTVNAVAPTVNNTNFSISSTTSTSATFVGGQVSAKGGADIATHGYVVGTASSVTWASGRVSEAGSNSDPGLNTNFTTMTTVTALSSGTTYYVRPFAYNGSLFGYGTAVSFTTPYAVSFDANGADDGDVPATRYIANGSTTTLPEQGTLTKAGYVFEGWAEGSTSGTVRAVGYSHTVNADITFYAKWRAVEYTDAKFSCADWSLTGPSGDIVFITSAASKTVRSQEAFHVSGSGLPHNTALTFTTSPINAKFEFKKADGTIPQTNEFGVVDADVYVFYTPSGEDTGDGLDEFTSLTVSVTGEPRTATIDTKRVIGRHLPADFVIAVKRNNKWYALPATMDELTNPSLVEISVDDINNPSIAYTAASNIYNLYGQNSGSGGKLYTNGETVKLGMKNNSNKPLFGAATGSSTVKGDGTAIVTNNIGQQYWWTLTQTATSITNPQDAQYGVMCSNNTAPFVLKENAGNPQWGFFTTGSVGPIRLIPASSITFTEAYFVEWAQHGGVIEVDAQGVAATSVVAHLGEATSSAITLVQTKASDAKNKNSKYNYTVNFGDGIDFADAAINGAMLTLEWKNGATTKAVSNIVVPKIIASSATMSSINSGDLPWSQWEVHVLPGVTLTANAGDFVSNDVIIKHLEIYPGATVVVTKGDAASGILTATTLVLRNGWSRAGEKTYDVARLYVTPSTSTLKATNVYADWYIDYDQYYPIAVPWNATVANFTYRYCSVSPTVGYDKNIRMRYYDGNSRATNVQTGVGESANWKAYGEGSNLAVPTTLTPSTGYAMTAKRPTGKAFSIIRMPLTLPSGTWGDGTWTTSGESGAVSETHKDQVSVTAYGTESTPKYAKGWNLIANPYMSLHQGAISYTGSETLVTYVNIPDVDFKEYDQQPAATAKLKPASAFLIQAPETGTITFGTANRKASTPSFRVEENPASTPEQQAYIVLDNEQSEDMMGILVSNKYTADYEINADLEKLLGDGTSLRTYMRYGDRNMAYVAINEMLAKEWIPVTVRIPEDGEYTYSLHEASIAGELEGVYLIDYQNGDHVTNLIEENYSFVAEAGTISGRFAINAIVGERQIPTSIDIINAGGDIKSNQPFKFIYNDKVFILHNGVIYDSTGKKVREIKK